MHLLGKVVVAVLVIVGLIFGTLYGIGFYLSPQDNLEKADAVVAISGGDTEARAQEAINLYKRGYADKVVMSGAASDRSGPSNAAVMRRQAIQEGVPEDKIVIEEQSRNTVENARDLVPILNQMGVKKIILVTSPYHQRRASITFHDAFGSDLQIINHSTTDTRWRKTNWWGDRYSLYVTLGELQKIVYLQTSTTAK